MISKSDLFRQTNAYAMQYGALFGLVWIIGFFCSLFSLESPMLQLLSLVTIVYIPFLGVKITKTFGKEASPEEGIGFGRAYLFSLLMYFYATLLLATASYIYFAYIDQGAFINSYINYLERPEVKELMETPEMKSQLQALMPEGYTFTEAINSLQGIQPIVIAANVLDINIFFAIVLSLPTAFFAKCKKQFKTN